ncbi:hypothetical protein BX600DRAFT_552407 [Xylariales sp. PMI_506]|nr:hypothetical protein BX600DRAFT_552407 [Xylariales sp. PMI_506]
MNENQAEQFDAIIKGNASTTTSSTAEVSAPSASSSTVGSADSTTTTSFTASQTTPGDKSTNSEDSNSAITPALAAGITVLISFVVFLLVCAIIIGSAERKRQWIMLGG